ncbi:MAG: S49 family peptidase, partial [Candidatus Zixiibacteriota bacterium]
SSIRPFTDEERQKFMGQIGAFYGYFTDLVSKNRKLDGDSVETLAQGKVWTGQEAMQNGLVDEVGGLKQAIDYTAAQLNLKDYRVVFYPEKRPLFDFSDNPLLKAAASILGIGSDKSSVNDGVKGLIDQEGLFSRLPFDIAIE